MSDWADRVQEETAQAFNHEKKLRVMKQKWNLSSSKSKIKGTTKLIKMLTNRCWHCKTVRLIKALYIVFYFEFSILRQLSKRKGTSKWIHQTVKICGFQFLKQLTLLNCELYVFINLYITLLALKIWTNFETF